MALSRVMVYGGKGALGSTVVSHFRSKDWVKLQFYNCNLLTMSVRLLRNPVGLVRWSLCQWGCQRQRGIDRIRQLDNAGRRSEYGLFNVLASRRLRCADAVKVESKVADVMRDDKFDAMLCVAGGWAGGSAASRGEERRLPAARCFFR